MWFLSRHRVPSTRWRSPRPSPREAGAEACAYSFLSPRDNVDDDEDVGCVADGGDGSAGRGKATGVGVAGVADFTDVEGGLSDGRQVRRDHAPHASPTSPPSSAAS